MNYSARLKVLIAVFVLANSGGSVQDFVLDKTVADRAGSLSLTVPSSWIVGEHSLESENKVAIRLLAEDASMAILIIREPLPEGWRGLEPLEALNLWTGSVLETLRHNGFEVSVDNPKKSLVPLVEGWTTVEIPYKNDADKTGGLAKATVVGDSALMFSVLWDLSTITSALQMESLTELAEEIQRTLKVSLDK